MIITLAGSCPSLKTQNQISIADPINIDNGTKIDLGIRGFKNDTPTRIATHAIARIISISPKFKNAKTIKYMKNLAEKGVRGNGRQATGCGLQAKKRRGVEAAINFLTLVTLAHSSHSRSLLYELSTIGHRQKNWTYDVKT